MTDTTKLTARKRTAIISLGAAMGDFEQWIIDEQRKEAKAKKRIGKQKPK
jgi:hypothetical protein